ncbi:MULTISPECIES: MFS transporter [unclassified Bacillus (in: firmicutes)]|uniref:MDR family MFS transporter n=1 Tax=unclassified Bacillus (in: firmicutes) TaxID=185979 RepID=UPI0008E414FA|nr:MULTISPECIES: MFS transporter [unclassified Bacillus (in: firmicutes)]SFB08535.1 Dipeptide/tripeptide permease [Bacillus sp. UNCCL13]SFQ87035.1 Dipeptide/tripeptide permease [Bacillus sp. cl95]
MRIRDWDFNLKVRLFGEALINITFWMFFPFLTIYFAEEFGKGTAGFLLVFSQIFSVLANLMGGYCADRYGRKTMMVIGSIGQGISFLIFAFANSPWLDAPWLSFMCYALAGVFGSFYWPASQAMVADVVDEKDRNHVFAIFYTMINIAVVVGPLLGAIFYTYYRFELLLVAGVICIVLGFVLIKYIRETVPVSNIHVKDHNEKWYAFLQNQIKEYGIIAKDKTFLMFIIAGVIGAQTFMQLDMLFPVYIKDVIDNQTLLSFGDWSFVVKGEQAFGLVLAENGLLVALFTVLVTRWMEHFKEKNVFIISSLLYAVSMIVFGQSSWIWGLILAMAIYTLGELMVAGIQQSFITKIAPEHMRGQYFAAASLRYTLGRTLAPLSIPLTVWLGYDWTFGILCLLSILTGVLYWLMFRKLEDSTKSVSPISGT